MPSCNTYRLTWVSLTLDMGYLLTGPPPDIESGIAPLGGPSAPMQPILLIAKFRLKLKKVGKTTRPFRYDLNQIPYDHTVEMRNRFKELDLIDTVSHELWTEVCDIVQGTGSNTIPRKKKCEKSTWLSEEALQIAVKRREAKSKGERKDIPI